MPYYVKGFFEINEDMVQILLMLKVLFTQDSKVEDLFCGASSGSEISAEKTKLMTNSANGIQKEIKVKGQKLGTVTSFKYLGAVVSDDGSKPEVL